MSKLGHQVLCSGHSRRASVSDYNVGPYYRSPHSLPLRIFLRVQVDDEINNMQGKNIHRKYYIPD